MTSIKIAAAFRWAFVVSLLALASAGPRAQSTTSGTLPAGEHHRWMDELFTRRPAAITQSLARFIFPGSHDSGTYRLELIPACEGCKNSDIYTNIEANCQDAVVADMEEYFCGGSTALMTMFGENWGEAQHLTVRQQLNAGARRFDVRFFRATADDASRSDGQLTEGTYYTHHSLAGPTSTVIFDDIEAFLNEPGHEREIVIIEFQQLMEGASAMDNESLGVLFDQLRSRIGTKMARKQVSECAGNPSCSATERFGHATTLADFLAQGSQVIVTSTIAPDNSPDIWDYIEGVSTYQINLLNSDAAEGYPAPDNDYYPWRTDKEVRTLIEDLSARRDNYSQDEMFTLGVEIGLDRDEDVPMVKSRAILRSVVCLLDPGNASGYCGAVNNDWDQFETLRESAAFLNPKAISSLVSLRRDRVNIVTSDHYTPAFTEEIFKLNYGATQVRLQIDRVIENDNPPLDSLDFDSNPDYYPVFWFPGAPPLQWELQGQRHNQIQNDDNILPFWSSFKSYPNDWGTAVAMFGIKDADGVADDDWSVINIPQPPAPGSAPDSPFYVTELLPVADCVANAASCLRFSVQQETSGLTADSASEVHYRRSACLWSYLPGDLVDPASLCEPEVSVRDASILEGNSGSRPMEFVIALSAPRSEAVSVRYSTSSGTAIQDSDYTGVVNELATFAPGQTRITGKVVVNGDTTFEADETFTLTLTEVDGAVIGRGAATGTILNDDGHTLRISQASHQEGSGTNTTFSFGITLSGASTEPVTVRYRTTDFTASAGSDYIAVPDTLVTFAPGETSKTVTVTVLGDYRVESDETFVVTLSQPTNATIDFRPGDGSGVIRNDDRAATLTGPGPQSGSEGDSTFNLGTLNDDRPGTSWTVNINWGDGTATTTTTSTPGALTSPHSFADNGTYTVTVTVTDADGMTSNTVTFTITIANVNPTAAFANNGPIDEGRRVIVGFSNPFDPAGADLAAGLRYAYSCSNDSLAAATYASSGNNSALTCAYDDNGPRVVRARIIDKDDGFTEYSTTVTVNNVAPTATFDNNGPINEGGSVTVSFSGAFDPSAPDTAADFRYAFSCANLPLVAVTYATGAATSSLACPFANEGVYTVRGRIFDKDDGATEYTTTVTVREVAPVISSVPAQSGNEGASLAFNLGALIDSGHDGPWTVSVAWGDSSVETFVVDALGPLARSHTYTDNGVFTVSVTARDANHVGSSPAAFAAAIANVAPQVGSLLLEDESGAVIGSPLVALSGLPIDLEASFTDAGTLDTHTGAINWGDGSSGAGTVSGGNGSGTLSASHTWSSPGTFTVNVTITDDDGGIGTRQTTIAVTDAKGAVCALPGIVTPLLSSPGLTFSRWLGLKLLLAQIHGNNDGQAANGACDMFAKQNYVAAVVKLSQAVLTVEGLVALGRPSTAEVEVLRQVEKRLVLAAKWTAVTLSRSTTNARKLQAAAARGAVADAAMASGNYFAAVNAWLDAVRLLAPGK